MLSRMAVGLRCSLGAVVVCVFAGCSEGLGVGVNEGASRPHPSVRALGANRITTDTKSVYFTNWMANLGNTGHYDVEFHFDSYGLFHAERHLDGDDQFGPDALFMARPRIGSPDDSIWVEVYQHEWGTRHFVARGSFAPSDSGVLKEFHGPPCNAVPDPIAGHNCDTWVMIQLKWDPVHYEAAYFEPTWPGRVFVGSREPQTGFVRLRDVDGDTIPGRIISWASSDTAIFTVDELGTLRGRRPGYGTLTASAAGFSRSILLEVENDLDATITGEGNPLPAQQCRYSATGGASNATLPYTYEWRVNDGPVVSRDRTFNFNVGLNGNHWVVSFRITDASGREGYDAINVHATTDGEQCGK